MQDSHRQIVIVTVGVFTILQIVVLLVFGYTPYPDSEGYIYYAKECIAHHELYPVSTLLNEYHFLWNIGAINLAALSLYIFHSIIPLLVVYSLMKGSMAWMLYAITKKMSNPQTALTSLMLFVIYPANYGEGTSLLSELPFMFFIFVALYLVIVKEWYLPGGMSLALANWFRPMAIVFLLALCIYMMYKWRKSMKIIVGYAVIILFIGLASMHRTGLFLYQAKTGWMALTDYSTHHAAASMNVRERHDWNVSQKDAAWRSQFFDWLKEHPVEYVKQMPEKIFITYVSDNVNMCTFIPDKTAKEYMYEEISMLSLYRHFPMLTTVQWLTVLNLIIYYLLLTAAVLSVIFCFRNNALLLPVSIIVSGTLVLLLAGHGEARFHIPFMPFVIIMSALFINQISYGKSRVD